MKRQLMAGLLTLASLAHNSAYADMLDLPDPGAPAEVTPTAPVTTAPAASATVTTPQTQFVGSLALRELSRKSGGTTYKVDLKSALSLVRLDLRITQHQLKLLSVQLVNESGQKVNVRQLTGTGVLATNTLISSESLNQSERIASIEITAESFGGEADALLTVIADKEVPKLTLREEKKEETQSAPQPTRPTPPTAPAPINESTVIRVGDTVLYASSSVGRVSAIFANGKANLVRDGYYDAVVNVSDLSKSLRCETSGRLCAGDKVAYGSSVGFAAKVFANGRALLQREGYYDAVVSVNDLGKAVSCAGVVCTGDQVVYGGSSGVAKAVFDNGVVQLVREGYYDSFVNVKDLGKALSCDNRAAICAGDVVYYAGTTGVAKRVYSNGRALLVRDGYYDAIVNTQDLAKSVRTLGVLSVGDRVNYTSTVGVLKALYTNGYALLVREGYYDAFVKASDLGKSVRCFDGICAGDTVLYGSTAGRVLQVFHNGNASLAREGYYDAIVRIRDLVKSVR